MTVCHKILIMFNRVKKCFFYLLPLSFVEKLIECKVCLRWNVSFYRYDANFKQKKICFLGCVYPDLCYTYVYLKKAASKIIIIRIWFHLINSRQTIFNNPKGSFFFLLCRALNYTASILCRVITAPPPKKMRGFLGMTLKCIWSRGSNFWELGWVLCYYSKVHSDQAWKYLSMSHLWVK